MAQTAAFYHRVLRKSPLAEGARGYLDGARRHVGDGGALPARVLARRAAGHHGRPRRKGFADRELDETGITRRGRSAGPSIAWPGRLIFTLFDPRGRPIAFAGRRLPPDESGAKYVNSPESPLWHKGSTLYGLHLARTAIAKARGGDRRRGLHRRDRARAGRATTTSSPRWARRSPSSSCASCASSRATSSCSSTPTRRAARLPCAASSSRRARSRPARARRTAAARLGSCRGRGGGREAVDAMLGGRRACSRSASRSCSTAADRQHDGASRPTRRSTACCAMLPATPERARARTARPSRLRLPAIAAARLAPAAAARRRATGERRPPRLRMDAAQRDERLLLALALAPGERGLAVLDRSRRAVRATPRSCARLWVRARLNQDDVPSVQDVERLEARARGAGGDGTAGPRRWARSRAVSSRAGSKRRLEPLKEKLAAAEITPEEMRELAELQALARSAGARTPPYERNLR